MDKNKTVVVIDIFKKEHEEILLSLIGDIKLEKWNTLAVGVDMENLVIYIAKDAILSLDEGYNYVILTRNINMLNKLLEYMGIKKFDNIENLPKEIEKRLIDFDPLTAIEVFNNINGLIDLGFNKKTAALNLLEEGLEFLGNGDDSRYLALEIYKKYNREVSEDEMVDALADIIVIAVGELLKMGYNPKEVLKEVSKVINSRKGKIIDGKYVKDKSENAKQYWYQPDFKKCKTR